ncbi:MULTISPECIES: hypothetical protein [Acinetobacter]|jgi:hypothetical protein|uniref:hypothetical protein n=1 Tax=Acinetobacter TaxID=469 RepID=UPI0014446718|nr:MULTISPECIES: hypothetical protein [Acinetobacter]UUS56678.1 hypothetical protein MST16_11375 [Acinetobacter sp. YH16040_T]UUS59860.1 hypothetical protein MST17_10755 [Acinetobacter sp. YH16056_T]
MKFKILSLAIFSSLILSACGGGSSDNSSTSSETGSGNGAETSSENNKWSIYSSSYWDGSDNLFEKTHFNIQNNTIYFNVDYLSNNNENYDLKWIISDYLTDEGLYTPVLNKTEYGYKFANLISKNDSQWIFTPASSQNFNGLKLTQNFEVVNLTGKEIGYYVDTFNYLSGADTTLATKLGTFPSFYYSKLKGKTFPQGSTCLRLKTSSSSKNYVELLGDNINGFDPTEYLDDGYTIQNIASYPVYISKNQPVNYDFDAYVQFNQNYRYGSYYKSGTTYTLANDIKDYQADLDEAIQNYGKDSLEAKVETNYVEAIKNECSLFNNIASTEIDKYSKLK